MMFFGHENMGITFGILSISALPPEILRNLGFRCRTSTGHHIGFMRFIAPKNKGASHKQNVSIYHSFGVREVYMF